MEDAFIVTGGKPLTGTVRLSGAKNISLKVLIAALLFDEPVSFENIPHIQDVEELIHVLRSIGVDVQWQDGSNAITVDPRGINSYTVDLLHASKMRVTFMLFAPFLIKKGKAQIPNPGGCRLGERPIDRQVDMMKSFGVTSTYDTKTGYYSAELDGRPSATTYRFTKQTHTGTELALMFAVFADGHSVIENSALEPEIDDLIQFLNDSGAKIERRGTSIDVTGVSRLTPPVKPYSILSDRNEAVTWAVAALATKGDILVEGARQELLGYFLTSLDNAGGGYEVVANGIRFYHSGRLKPTDVMTCPEPGFMTDWQAPWAVLMTQADGESTLIETVFENRFGFVGELKKFGATISFYDPALPNPDSVYQFNLPKNKEFKQKKQAIRIKGPSLLHSGVVNVMDLRAGATVLIAACIAQGESVIKGAGIIDRGYEHIEKKLMGLGVHIKRL